jgi:hypothetical protein
MPIHIHIKLKSFIFLFVHCLIPSNLDAMLKSANEDSIENNPRRDQQIEFMSRSLWHWRRATRGCQWKLNLSFAHFAGFSDYRLNWFSGSFLTDVRRGHCRLYHLVSYECATKTLLTKNCYHWKNMNYELCYKHYTTLITDNRERSLVKS